MTTSEVRRIRRVLVALDTSPDSVAAAAAAARMAAALEAELAGLFVEDRDLLRLSESGHARQVGFLTATAERLGSDEMRRQLRAQAARAERMLADLAEREGITFTFRTARGRVATEVLAAAEREDLVSVGRIGWSHGRRRLGSTTRALLARRRSHTLLVDRSKALATPVAVVCDGSAAAAAALRLARQLAGQKSNRLVVLATDPEAAQAAKQQLDEPGAAPRVDLLAAPLARAVAMAARQWSAGLVVLPVERPWLSEAELADLLAQLRCPVLAVS